jgi:hypothetical protein
MGFPYQGDKAKQEWWNTARRSQVSARLPASRTPEGAFIDWGDPRSALTANRLAPTWQQLAEILLPGSRIEQAMLHKFNQTARCRTTFLISKSSRRGRLEMHFKSKLEIPRVPRSGNSAERR